MAHAIPQKAYTNIHYIFHISTYAFLLVPFWDAWSKRHTDSQSILIQLFVKENSKGKAL